MGFRFYTKTIFDIRCLSKGYLSDFFSQNIFIEYFFEIPPSYCVGTQDVNEMVTFRIFFNQCGIDAIGQKEH